MKKLTNQDVQILVDKIQDNQYELIENYTGSKNKMHFKCRLCGEVIFRSLDAMRFRIGENCKHISHSLSNHDVQVRLDRIQNEQYELISDYTGKDSLICVRCRACGHQYKSIANNLFRKRYGKNCNHNIEYSSDEIAKIVYKESRGKYSLISKAYGMCKLCRIKCNDCGYEWFGKPINVVNHIVSLKCNHKKIYTEKQIVDLITSVHKSKIKMIGPYTTTHTSTQFVCENGHHFVNSPEKSNFSKTRMWGMCRTKKEDYTRI